jgi:pilus assembly protein Flp/PilA
MADPYQALALLYVRGTEGLRRRLQRNQDGQGMVEYALILVLIAIVVIVIISTVGKRVNNVFSNISNGLSQ